MLVLHFSHVWSLGGVARARGVGKEDWGLRELGRKAGVPPGRREGRQTHQSWPTAAAGCLHALRLLQHAARTHAYRRASGVAPGVSVGSGGRKRSGKIPG